MATSLPRSGWVSPMDVLRLEGIRDVAEIRLDRWGIPHIYASSARDAWFAQGFNGARDRLWQLDLWRRAGLGRLAEVLGAGYVERDRAARLFLYRGSMEEEWSAYGCDLGAVLTPFVEGINSYVRETQERPELLSPEFKLLGYEPAEWSAGDILRIRSHGKYRNLYSEFTRARMLHTFGPSAEELRVRLEPHRQLELPEGLDLSLIEADSLRVYSLATRPALSVDCAPYSTAGTGSNNWVVGGGRTATGRPILANDPHGDLRLPSLRYLVHVSSPELEFVGGGEPMLPGISFGHNGQIGFGLTVLPIDQEDLYIYELDEVGGNRYRYGSGWESIERERQSIEVRDADPVNVELRFTRHGPIIHECPERNAALAVRAAWLQAGMVPYLGGLALLQADGWEEFRAAASHWGGPGENLVYADAGGNIGWQATGRVPIRPNWDGLLPVPGDGRFEWAGYADPAAMPRESNPERGWIATANQFNVAPDPKTGLEIAVEWEPPFRYRRIAEALEASDRLTVEASASLQSDYACLAARPVLRELEGFTPRDTRVSLAVELLRGWNGRLEARSAAAALFECWFRKHLRRSLFASALEGKLDADLVESAISAVMRDESRVRDARIDLDLLALEIDTQQSCDSLFETSLCAAMIELEGLLGPDVASWRWGNLHEARFAHPLVDLASGPHAIEPVARGGSCDTVGNTDYGNGIGGFLQKVGATSRLVLDVGNWDRSVAVNVPGQAGRPGDPHYADMHIPWSEDLSVPLLFSRPAVEAATERRIVCCPGPGLGGDRL